MILSGCRLSVWAYASEIRLSDKTNRVKLLFLVSSAIEGGLLLPCQYVKGYGKINERGSIERRPFDNDSQRTEDRL